MIEFHEVSKRFGQTLAVDRLTLEVRRGELVAFLGPNGAGKTTTIKMLCGLLRPTSGTIHAGGFDLVDQGLEARRLMGYVPDEPYLYEKLTGREFLRFVGEMYGMPAASLDRRIGEMVDRFEMRGYCDDLCEQYSHGMKQRTVFASALLHEPEVLVLDEPMVGLDPRSARFVKDLLRAKADAGMTIFMSTHTLAVAEELADRIGIVDHGRLVSAGTLDDLRRELQMEGRLEDLFLKVTADAEGEVVG